MYENPNDIKYKIAATMAESTEKLAEETVEQSFIGGIVNEIVTSPLNLLLVSLIVYLIYKIIRSRSDTGESNVPSEPELPKLRRDFTVQELKNYDGTQPDGRVLVAVNGHVYDVTKGKKFYGPGIKWNLFIFFTFPSNI